MNRARRSHKQLRRATLYGEQNGQCFWCDEPMILLPRYPKDGRVGPKVCTLDHLRDRHNPTRNEPNLFSEQRLVAACRSCNQQRDQARIRIRVQHEREMRA